MEMARRLAPNAPGVDVAFGRIKHWTRQGLLQPAGEENPGRGRSVEYLEDELRKARVLAALADGGVEIRVMRAVMDSLGTIKSVAPPGMVWILTVEKEKPTIRLLVDDGGEYIRALKRDADSVLLLNLTRVMGT
jgi:hypothetical protein